MTGSSYRIATLDDILQVPADARPRLFRDLETALLTHELVYGEFAQRTPIGELSWMDDDDRGVKITDSDGHLRFELKVETKKPPEGGSHEA